MKNMDGIGTQIKKNGRSDAASVLAAVAVANGGNMNMNSNSLRLSALKESPFLPSVSGDSRKII
jgi:hypothetical protein